MYLQSYYLKYARFVKGSGEKCAPSAVLPHLSLKNPTFDSRISF